MNNFFNIGNDSIRISNIKDFGVDVDKYLFQRIYIEHTPSMKEIEKDFENKGFFKAMFTNHDTTYKKGDLIPVGRITDNGIGRYYCSTKKHGEMQVLICEHLIQDSATGEYERKNLGDKWKYVENITIKEIKYLYITTYQGNKYLYFEEGIDVNDANSEYERLKELIDSSNNKKNNQNTLASFEEKNKKLKIMLDSGLISNEEAEEMKNKLLNEL